MGLRCEKCGATVTAAEVETVRVFRVMDEPPYALDGTVEVRLHGYRCGPVLDDEERFSEWRTYGEAVG